MEPKNRLMIVAAVTVLILGAMLTSFGRSLFALHTPDVVLPSQIPPAQTEPAPQGDGSERMEQVELTRDTVQAVIRTLTRTESYYRELTVETFWEGHSSATQVKAWTDGPWSHSRQVLPSGAIRHDITGEGDLYYWYEGSRRYLSAEPEAGASDLAQRIPTYETVLALSKEQITEAGYTLLDTMPCIYVEFADRKLDLTTRFWVSIDSGLLLAAEQDHGDTLVYRMSSSGSLQTPCPPDAPFVLPDGSQLHEV